MSEGLFVDGAEVTSGVIDLMSATDASNLMSQLQREGLVENIGGEGLVNERWTLTPYGERLIPWIEEYERELEAKEEGEACTR
jgi:hypothetical protein